MQAALGKYDPLKICKSLMEGKNPADSPGFFLPEFLRWSFDQDLQPFLCYQLRNLSEADSLVESLRPEYARQVLLESQRFIELQSLFTAFTDQNIPSLVLKGTALAYSIYPEPFLRPRCDTDFLIPKSDFSKVDLVALKLGYHWENAVEGDLISYQRMASKVDIWGFTHVLDVHWKLSNPQLFADLFSWQELWDTSVPIAKLHPRARALSPVHQLLHACIHRVSHHPGDEHRVWDVDLYFLTRTFSQAQWEETVEIAHKKKILSLLSECLLQPKMLFDIVIPESILTALKNLKEVPEATAAFLRPGFGVKDIWFSDFKHLPFSKKLRLLKEHILPSPGYLYKKYSQSRFRWLPWLYLRRILSGCKKWVWK